MKILLIDNYDSFTYNLLHFLEALVDEKIDVVRNDQVGQVALTKYTHCIISPGPGLPSESGGLMQFMKKLGEQSVLGVCLGHQAIGELFGMKLRNIDKVVHGQSRKIRITQAEDSIFRDLPSEFKVGRYHSWLIDRSSLSNDFVVTATDESGEIMAISHRKRPIKGVQFHPESVLTEYGREILKNWLNS